MGDPDTVRIVSFIPTASEYNKNMFLKEKEVLRIFNQDNDDEEEIEETEEGEEEIESRMEDQESNEEGREEIQ